MDYRLLFYWGLSLSFISIGLIYYSFGDAFAMILSIGDKKITLLTMYIIVSMLILMTKYMLDESKENNLRYQISNVIFYVILLFFVIYVPLEIYLNLIIFPLYLAMLLSILIFCISGISSLQINRNRRQKDEQEDFSYQ